MGVSVAGSLVVSGSVLAWIFKRGSGSLVIPFCCESAALLGSPFVGSAVFTTAGGAGFETVETLRRLAEGAPDWRRKIREDTALEVSSDSSGMVNESDSFRRELRVIRLYSFSETILSLETSFADLDPSDLKVLVSDLGEFEISATRFESGFALFFPLSLLGAGIKGSSLACFVAFFFFFLLCLGIEKSWR